MSSVPLPHQNIRETSANDGSFLFAGANYGNVTFYNRELNRPPQSSFVVPFRRDPDFVNRDDLLSRLDERCSQPAGRAALVGFGGVGKSQLAIEYTYRIQKQSPDISVFWVHASNTARFEQGYRDIANAVNVAGREDLKADIFKLVHDWLYRCEGKWLLILDNIDNLDLFPETGDANQRGQENSVDGKRRQPISAYLPQSQNGSILVISRRKDIALKLVEEKEIIEVQPMAPAHALSLFEKKLGPLDQGDDTVELAAALEYMPLAIVQAAAYISQRAPRYSVQHYLEDYRKGDRKKTSLLNHEGGQLRRDWQAKNSIIITWQISFEHIDQARPSAADLLSLMSFFDRQGIPEALVRKRAESGNGHRNQEEHDQHDGREDEEEDEEEKEEDGKDHASECSEDDWFEGDVQMLKNYSFLSVGTDRTFEMHALVQLATRHWLEANGKLERWKQCYIKNLSAEFLTGKYENWTYCRALFPHVRSAITQRLKAEDSLREWASLLYHAAWYTLKKGSIREAIDLSKIAMKVRKKMLGLEHEETLRSISMLGQAYKLGGRWTEAEELTVQALNIRKKVLGQEHSSTLIDIANLALIYKDQGRWTEAEELAIQVIKTMKRVLGQEHPSTLIIIANLATIYIDQGRWTEAEELNVQVIKIRKRVLGQEHPDTLTNMANLAITLVSQTRYEEAIPLMEHCIELRKRHLGPEHPHTKSSLRALHEWKRQADEHKQSH